MNGEAMPHARGDEDVLRLTDELRRIASRIRDSVPVRPRETAPDNDADELDHLKLAEAMLAARRRIGNHFAPGLFADPARDLLLDLYVSGLRGKAVSISSACIAAAVPATTALRWIRKLRQSGLVRIERDTADNRRVLVHLTERAISQMVAYMGDVSNLLPSRR